MKSNVRNTRYYPRALAQRRGPTQQPRKATGRTAPVVTIFFFFLNLGAEHEKKETYHRITLFGNRITFFSPSKKLFSLVTVEKVSQIQPRPTHITSTRAHHRGNICPLDSSIFFYANTDSSGIRRSARETLCFLPGPTTRSATVETSRPRSTKTTARAIRPLRRNRKRHRRQPRRLSVLSQPEKSRQKAIPFLRRHRGHSERRLRG